MRRRGGVRWTRLRLLKDVALLHGGLDHAGLGLRWWALLLVAHGRHAGLLLLLLLRLSGAREDLNGRPSLTDLLRGVCVVVVGEGRVDLSVHGLVGDGRSGRSGFGIDEEGDGRDVATTALEPSTVDLLAREVVAHHAEELVEAGVLTDGGSGSGGGGRDGGLRERRVVGVGRLGRLRSAGVAHGRGDAGGERRGSGSAGRLLLLLLLLELLLLDGAHGATAGVRSGRLRREDLALIVLALPRVVPLHAVAAVGRRGGGRGSRVDVEVGETVLQAGGEGRRGVALRGEVGVRVAGGGEIGSRRGDGARRGSALVAEAIGSTTEAFPVGLATVARSWTLLTSRNNSAHASSAPAEGRRGHAVVVNVVASFLLLDAEGRVAVIGVDRAVVLTSKGERRSGTTNAES